MRLFAYHHVTAACITPCTGSDEKHDLRAAVEPREPEERGEQIPLRDVNVIAAPEAEHEDGPRNDERVANEQE